jgi:hypothetical protein
MKRVLAATTAAVIGVGALAAPKPAHAVAEWVIPTIIGAGAVGVAVGATAATPNYYYTAAPAGTITVQPTCHIERGVVNGVWQRVRVCPY